MRKPTIIWACFTSCSARTCPVPWRSITNTEISAAVTTVWNGLLALPDGDSSGVVTPRLPAVRPWTPVGTAAVRPPVGTRPHTRIRVGPPPLRSHLRGQHLDVTRFNDRVAIFRFVERQGDRACDFASDRQLSARGDRGRIQKFPVHRDEAALGQSPVGTEVSRTVERKLKNLNPCRFLESPGNQHL